MPIETAYLRYAVCGCCLCIKNANCYLELKNIEYLRDFVTVSRRLGLRIDDIESNPAYVGSGLSVYTITVTICSSELKKYKTHHEIIEALKSLDYIYHLEELR